jgi:hypothetical protein
MSEAQETSVSRDPLFPLGQVVATPGAIAALKAAGELPFHHIARHVRGDWGEIPDEDREENELSLREGFRILSAYRTRLGTRLWVITEADRSSTCLLLPEEY